jgi:acyl transferase domain-containing protein/acyl carrier protein
MTAGSSPMSANPLAIVGMGCRVRGAAGPDDLWSLVRRGEDVVGPSPRRWWGDVYDPDPFARGKSVSRFGSFLDDVEGIDWRFFGISPREARSIDPQHRLLLEVAWETLEDAGMPFARAAGSRAGVFVGIMLNDYGRLYGRDLRSIDGYTTQNNTFAYAANRLSFYFDLRGPSLAIDTNCSGSLLAIHQACRSVWTGESDWALAGGVSLILAPDVDISMSKATALSPTGRVRTWDARADGFVRGEGAGLVLVKPLDAAVAAGDRIYALVLGTAANHKGRGNWIVEPSSEAQRDAIRTACAVARIDPTELDYVELHGTGTPKGDPVEAAALGAVMVGRPAGRPLRVGSIKTNIGHLDAAAGVAGLIKAALCIHREELVPSLHFETRNPAIDLEGLNLRVQTAVEPWPRADRAPTAGVTAIGFGGTNVHAVLRGFEGALPASAPEEPSYVLPLSAKSDEALQALAERYGAWLAGLPGEARSARTGLGDVAYTLATRRTHHDRRLAVTGASLDVVAEKLRGLRAASDGRPRAGRRGDSPPRVAFVFPGHGPQWLGMARDLVCTNRAFTDALATCDALVQEETGWSVHDELFAAPEASRLDRPEFVQPVLFAVEVALTALWRSWGIVPDAVVGHSFGEIAAAVAAGALTLEEAVRIVCARGRVTQTRAGRGAVAVVDLPGDEVRELLGRYRALEIGGENSPTTTVVTGEPAAISALLEDLAAREIFARRVKLGYASHSRDMDGILPAFAAQIGSIEGRTSSVQFVSTVHGAPIAGTSLGSAYWLRNLREPVRFAEAVRAVESADPGRGIVFLEIGPHPVLTVAVRQTLEGRGEVLDVLASLQRGQPSLASLDEALGRLYAAGLDPDWTGRYPAGRVVSTPTYSWQHERMWLDVGDGAAPSTPREMVHPLLGRQVDGPDGRTLAWEQAIGGPETAYFRDHCLQGVPSASTSAMVEMILAAASRTLGSESLELYDIELRRAFVLPHEGTYQVQTLLTRGPEWVAEVRGRLNDQRPWRTHATARVRLASGAPEAPTFDAPLATRLTTAEAYRELADRGLQYGPTFHGIEWLSREGEGVLACVRLPDGLDPKPYFFHPAMHDAAMHVAVLAEACREHTGVLPVRIERIWVHSRPGAVLRSHARVARVGGGMRADIRVETVGGDVVEIIQGIELAHLDDAIRTTDPPVEEASWLYGLDWVELAPSREPVAEATAPVRPVWVILGDRLGVGAALAERIRASGADARVLTPEALSRPGDAVSLPGDGSLAGVIHLWNLDLPDVVDAVGSKEIDTAILSGCNSAILLLRSLEEAIPAVPTPIWFVTRGAQAWGLRPGEIAPLQAPVWGLARAAAVELPSRWGGLVDLDPSASPADSASKLWAWLQAAPPGEDEVLFRDGRVYGGRLVRRGTSYHAPESAASRPIELRADATYLVTGGTGGLGLTVARWLADRGARHLVLAARTPLPPRDAWADVPADSPLTETLDALRAIEGLGTTAHVVSLDVSDHEAVIEFINGHERSGRPSIRGVFHLAGVVRLEDILRVGPEELFATLRPKIHGALALHRWLEDLDHFVLFSSAASVIRSPRMAHYAAGNSFLDTLAHMRRARGQSALSIDWGLWSDVGFIRHLGDRGPGAMKGMKSIAPDVGIRILERLIANGDVQTVVWPPDWEQWARTYPGFTRTSLIAHLLGRGDAHGPTQARSTVHSMLQVVSGEGAGSSIRDHVAREIAAQLRIAPDQLALDEPLERLGFDSLQATELQARFSSELGVRIPILRLLGFASAQTIADEVEAGIRDSERRLRAAPVDGEAVAAVGDRPRR